MTEMYLNYLSLPSLSEMLKVFVFKNITSKHKDKIGHSSYKDGTKFYFKI